MRRAAAFIGWCVVAAEGEEPAHGLAAVLYDLWLRRRGGAV